MNINGKDFKQYNASVVSFNTKTLGIENNILISESNLIPLLGEQKLTAQERDLVIDFISEDDISNFTVECCKESVVYLDDGYRYLCYLNSTPDIQTDGYQAFTATYPMLVIKQKDLMTVNPSKSFIVQGNVNCGCIYEISASVNVSNIVVDGYKIKSIKAGDTFVIDGIDKLIYCKSDPSTSTFDDVDLTSFPKLLPGKHDFTCNSDKVTTVIKYYPIFM